MKKIISVLLSVMMILQMGVVASAAGETANTPSFVANTILKDAEGNALEWIADMEIVQVGAKTVLYATKRASETNTGVFAFDVTDVNNPVLIDSKAMQNVWYKTKLDVVDFNGKKYLVATGSIQLGTQAWRINSDGTLEDGVASVGSGVQYPRDMATAGNTLVIVDQNRGIIGHAPRAVGTWEMLEEFQCDFNPAVNFSYLVESTGVTHNVPADYSTCFISAVGAREIGGDIYIAVATNGILKAGALVEGNATDADSESTEHFIELRKKVMLNRWNNDGAFYFQLVSREKIDGELETLKFVDDDTLVTSYYSGSWNSESVGLYQTEIDLDATEAADVIKVNPVVTQTSGTAILPLNDDYFAIGSRKDLGYLDIYNEETGEMIYRYNYPDNRPSALAQFNGNIYSTTEDGQLYVNNYAKSKSPAYDTFATYKPVDGGPTSVALVDANGERLSPANANYGEMTGAIEVTEVNGRRYAYVAKRMAGIYVYDVTNYGQATWVQTIPFEDTTTSRNTEIDILEVDDEKFLAVNETSLGGKYLLPIGADGKLSSEAVTIAWANHYESDLVAIDNWLIVTGGVYNEMGIYLYRYNGKDADLVVNNYISIPVTDGEVFEANGYNDGDAMYIAAKIYVPSTGIYRVDIFKVSLTDFTSELVVSKDMTDNFGNSINGFEFIDNDTVLVSVYTNLAQQSGTIGLGIMEFDEEAHTADYTPLDTQRSTVSLQVLDKTGRIMFIEKYSTQTSVALASVYDKFEMWSANPYRWWNNNNTDTWRIEDGLLYDDVLYTLSMSGDLYLWRLGVADVACDDILSDDAKLSGEIYGYQAGDVVSIYLAGKDYTTTVSADGTFTSEVIDIDAGEMQNGAVILVRGGSVAAIRDIQVSYAGEDGAVLNITSLKDSEGNDAAGFVEGTMTLNAKVVTDKKASKKAILAVYEDGMLKSIQQKEIAGNNGQVSFEFAVEDAANTSAKLMLWESMKGMYPLVEAEDISFDVNF